MEVVQRPEVSLVAIRSGSCDENGPAGAADGAESGRELVTIAGLNLDVDDQDLGPMAVPEAASPTPATYTACPRDSSRRAESAWASTMRIFRRRLDPGGSSILGHRQPQFVLPFGSACASPGLGPRGVQPPRRSDCSDDEFIQWVGIRPAAGPVPQARRRWRCLSARLLSQVQWRMCRDRCDASSEQASPERGGLIKPFRVLKRVKNAGNPASDFSR